MSEVKPRQSKPVRNAKRDAEIRALFQQGKRQAALAAEYGLTQPRISQIIKRG